MAAHRIRADYETLQQIAQGFTRQAEAARQSLQVIQRAKDKLESGDWIGTGATKFYQEMDSAVLPSLQRLVAALEEASQATLKTRQVMQKAEEDVSRLFRGGGASPKPPEILHASAQSAAGGNILFGSMDMRPTMSVPTPFAISLIRDSQGKARMVSVRPGPDDTEVVTVDVPEMRFAYSRPRPRDARETKVQDLIDKAQVDPKPENFQKAIDEAVKLYDIDVSSVRGKPTFNPLLPPAIRGITGVITQKIGIGPGAFNSPGALASTIRHETFHAEIFQDYWDVDDPQSWALAHVGVYDKQLAYAGRDRLRQSEIDAVRKSRAIYYDQLTPDNRTRAGAGDYAISH